MQLLVHPCAIQGTAAARMGNSESKNEDGKSPSTTSRQPKTSASRGPAHNLLSSTSPASSSTSAAHAHGSVHSSNPPAKSDREKSASSAISPQSQPVHVPQKALPLRPGGLDKAVTEEAPINLNSAGRYDRPPRLPLPIADAVADASLPADNDPSPDALSGGIKMESDLHRRTSILSSTTLEDEDEYSMLNQSAAPTVPTTITWKGHADKVYVTGTFVSWDRKFKLHRDPDGGSFSATLPLKPGTHHLMFLVDGDMSTSADLPTTVDYTNILVNYIEVMAPEHQPAQPMTIPGAAGLSSSGTPLASSVDVRPPGHGRAMSHHSAVHFASPKPPKAKYTTEIPLFLLDHGLNDSNDYAYRRSCQVIAHLPAPPTLPVILGKSILNATTPHKDDSSVLPMPNHTVLNHLATSSIKNGVLATSATTRINRKVCHPLTWKYIY
ncbi:carbohydrate-binding module family 48 protein [Piedraia hortae CBS 480.64]|uniref:Carbohydrate-binding module family 48 protein n=1 Tax=Piedraia hortae CBS 480.64 TaxID=1314780 RepID=A0A6A7C2R6_9PEZI|nr:carbohydrate-binding module family 48 protein [Piedraia hortae CBS 480.64]